MNKPTRLFDYINLQAREFPQEKLYRTSTKAFGSTILHLNLKNMSMNIPWHYWPMVW